MIRMLSSRSRCAAGSDRMPPAVHALAGLPVFRCPRTVAAASFASGIRLGRSGCTVSHSSGCLPVSCGAVLQGRICVAAAAPSAAATRPRDPSKAPPCTICSQPNMMLYGDTCVSCSAKRRPRQSLTKPASAAIHALASLVAIDDEFRASAAVASPPARPLAMSRERPPATLLLKSPPSRPYTLASHPLIEIHAPKPAVAQLLFDSVESEPHAVPPLAMSTSVPALVSPSSLKHHKPLMKPPRAQQLPRLASLASPIRVSRTVPEADGIVASPPSAQRAQAQHAVSEPSSQRSPREPPPEPAKPSPAPPESRSHDGMGSHAPSSSPESVATVYPRLSPQQRVCSPLLPPASAHLDAFLLRAPTRLVSPTGGCGHRWIAWHRDALLQRV